MESQSDTQISKDILQEFNISSIDQPNESRKSRKRKVLVIVVASMILSGFVVVLLLKQLMPNENDSEHRSFRTDKAPLKTNYTPINSSPKQTVNKKFANFPNYPLGIYYYIDDHNIYALNEELKTITQITQSRNISDIEYGPDKNSFLIVEDGEIFQSDLKGNVLKKLTNSDRRIMRVRISPDLTKVAYDYAEDWVLPMTYSEDPEKVKNKRKYGMPLTQVYVRSINDSDSKEMWPPVNSVNNQIDGLYFQLYSGIEYWLGPKSIVVMDKDFLSGGFEWLIDVEKKTALSIPNLTPAKIFPYKDEAVPYATFIRDDLITVYDRNQQIVYKDSTSNGPMSEVSWTPDDKYLTFYLDRGVVRVIEVQQKLVIDYPVDKLPGTAYVMMPSVIKSGYIYYIDNNSIKRLKLATGEVETVVTNFIGDWISFTDARVWMPNTGISN